MADSKVRDLTDALETIERDLLLVLNDLQGRVEAGKLAMIEGAAYKARCALDSAVSPEDPAKIKTAARTILDNRFGGYGNRKAMHAMWNFVHDQHGRHMLPVSHYDGVFQAGLRALAGVEPEKESA